MPKPKTPEQLEQEARWPGDGPAVDAKLRLIYVVYQLSQEGQQRAFLTTTDEMKAHLTDSSVDRVQWRKLRYTDDEYRDALKMAWFDPAGHAIVFIGGRDAFAQSKNKNERPMHHWVEAEGQVPGPWRVKSQFITMSYTSRSLEQTNAAPCMIDDSAMSTGDLLDIEQARRYEIRQSKREADEKLAALNKRNS